MGEAELERIHSLERENRILKKKVERSESNRAILEEVLASHIQSLRVVNAEIVQSRESVLAFISDGVFSVDNEWRITHVNPAALQMIFQGQDSVLGKDLWETLPEMRPFYEEYYRAKSENLPVQFEVLMSEANRIVEMNVYPTPSGLLAIFRDITEKKMLEKEMTRLDRLNLIGQMAAGIAHEIRNPMTTVRGFLQVFLQKAEFTPFNSRLELMISELDRANSIIKEYLSLARNKKVNSSPQSLNGIIKTLLPLIESDAILGGKWITTQLDKDIPDLILDVQEIRQLILNFSRNGLEAMSQGGELTIGTFREKEEVVLFIRDQGTGIPEEVQQKLGTPFLTTKENGTGLGMAICYSIAHRHNAQITAETSRAGTTFMIHFPLV